MNRIFYPQLDFARFAPMKKLNVGRASRLNLLNSGVEDGVPSPLDTGRKLSMQKTFKRHLDVLCTFNLCCVQGVIACEENVTGKCIIKYKRKL